MVITTMNMSIVQVIVFICLISSSCASATDMHAVFERVKGISKGMKSSSPSLTSTTVNHSLRSLNGSVNENNHYCGSFDTICMKGELSYKFSMKLHGPSSEMHPSSISSTIHSYESDCVESEYLMGVEMVVGNLTQTQSGKKYLIRGTVTDVIVKVSSVGIGHGMVECTPPPKPMEWFSLKGKKCLVGGEPMEEMIGTPTEDTSLEQTNNGWNMDGFYDYSYKDDSGCNVEPSKIPWVWIIVGVGVVLILIIILIAVFSLRSSSSKKSMKK